MARPQKTGLDYFAHDVDILHDKKIKLIKAKHGLIGYAFYIRLLEEIYRDEGYFLRADEEFMLLFSDDNSVPLDLCKDIISDCVGFGLFDADLFHDYGVLSSVRIQESYIFGTQRRKDVEFIGEYLLVDLEDKYNIENINVVIYSINANNNSVNDGINPQRKEKKRIEKYSKELLLSGKPDSADEDEKELPSDESKAKRGSESIPYAEIVEYLNQASGSNYKHTSKATRAKINARWAEGYRLSDFQKVIDKKANEWMHSDMAKFLRPETLFGPKFEGYLNQPATEPKAQETDKYAEMTNEELWARYGVQR